MRAVELVLLLVVVQRLRPIADIFLRLVVSVALRIMADDYDGPDCVILARMGDNAALEDIIAKPVRAANGAPQSVFAPHAPVLDPRRKASPPRRTEVRWSGERWARQR